MLLNTSDTLEVLKQVKLTHTLPRMELAFSEKILPLDMSDSEATISLKVMKKNLLKDFLSMAQLQFHSKLFLVSKATTVEFTALTTVEKQQMMSTMQFWLLAMEMKTEKTSGTSRTHGEAHGESTDISRWKEEPTCVR